MHHQIFLQLICFVLVLTTFQISYTLEFHEGEAKVELIKKRLRRSTGTEGGDLGEPAEDHPRNYEYDVRVTAFGISHDLKLTHAGSIISSNFKYHEIYTNESGHVVWKDVTPSLERLEELENNIYHDIHTNTVLKVEHLSNGEINLNGIINHAKIRTRRSLTDFFNSNSSNHVIQYPKIIQPPELNISDYITLGPAISLIPRQGVNPNELPPIEPELAFVIEKTLSDLFTTNDSLLEYMAIMIKAVNSMYSLTPVPEIKFKFVGLHRIMDEDAQPFMVLGRRRNNEYVLVEVLEEFAEWANQNQNLLGPHDISPLQLGVNFTVRGLKGLAPIGGACRFDLPCGIGVSCSAANPTSQDAGGHFAGVFTLAHELGHSLGALHDGDPGLTDGDPGATACPFPDGFMMSYLGWGTLQRFKFSPCSLRSMRIYASSNEAKCLFQPNGLPTIKSGLSLESGDVINADQLCKREKGHEASVFDPSPDDSCRNTICKFPHPFEIGEIGFAPLQIFVGNNAPCGKTGRCRNGYCVGQGPPKSLDEICQSMTNELGWVFDQSKNDLNPSNNVCSRNGKLYCKGLNGQTDEPFSIGQFGIVLPVGTICNPAKKLICFNQACVAQDSISHPEKECILHTKKMEAVKTSLNCASNGVNCTYGTESEVLNTQGSNEGAACDSGSGICVRGKCNPRHPVTTAENGGPQSLLKICSELMHDPNAKILTSLGPREFARDKYCKGLTCLSSDGTTKEVVGNVPDGTVCGPLRKCKNGVCVVCRQ